jgi:hypothetical protein
VARNPKLEKNGKPAKTRETLNAGDLPKVADSMRSAAAMLGYDISVVEAAKNAGCKAFVGSRVDCFELEQWLADHPEIQTTATIANTLDQAELIQSISRALQRRDAYRKSRRELIEVEEVKATLTKCVAAVKTNLLAIPATNCQRLALMTDAIEIEQLLRAALVKSLHELSENEWVG